MANHYTQRGHPVMAAACFLAIGDTQSAIHRLILGHEIDLAFAACTVLGIRSDIVFRAAAKRYENQSLWYVLMSNLSSSLARIKL
jgi:hypothetical protein